MSSEVTDLKEDQQQLPPAGAPAPAKTAKQADGEEHKQDGTGTEEDEGEEETSSTRELYEEAKRELALKHYSVAADKLAHVLEDLQDEDAETRHESDDPILAQILHRYGKAVLGLAIANSGALGGGGGGGDTPQLPAPKAGPSSKKQKDDSAPVKSYPRFSFGGDAEEEEEEEEEAEEPQQAEEAGEEEDEDDFALAFTVLDLARVIYEKQLTASGDSAVLKTYEGEELTALQIKAQLAEVYNDLGDVGLETENFQQASSDYEQSLKILSPLLRPHSRRLADAQLRLGLALEFHPDTSQRPRAAEFVAAAKTTLNTLLTALSRRQKTIEEGGEEAGEGASGEAQAPEAEAAKQNTENGKGKGKARVGGEEQLLEKDDVAGMDLDRLNKERKDLGEMIEELDLKMQEYEQAGANGADAGASASAGAGTSSTAIGVAGGVDRAALEKAISEAFLGASSNAIFPGAPSDKPVNDLSAMVKKRKPVAAAEQDVGKGKRKQEEDVPAPNGSATSVEESDAKRVKTA